MVCGDSDEDGYIVVFLLLFEIDHSPRLVIVRRDDGISSPVAK